MVFCPSVDSIKHLWKASWHILRSKSCQARPTYVVCVHTNFALAPRLNCIRATVNDKKQRITSVESTGKTREVEHWEQRGYPTVILAQGCHAGVKIHILSKNSHIEKSQFLPKNHLSETSFFTKFTFLKSQFS